MYGKLPRKMEGAMWKKTMANYLCFFLVSAATQWHVLLFPKKMAKAAFKQTGTSITTKRPLNPKKSNQSVTIESKKKEEENILKTITTL